MDEHRNYAYRYLLYWAMLETRSLEWFPRRGWHILNPLYWRREFRRIRRIGALADWLHNLAAFSGSDFDGFDEQWFWRDHESFCRRHAGFGFQNYKDLFESHLEESRLGQQTAPGWQP